MARLNGVQAQVQVHALVLVRATAPAPVQLQMRIAEWVWYSVHAAHIEGADAPLRLPGVRLRGAYNVGPACAASAVRTMGVRERESVCVCVCEVKGEGMWE